MPAAEVRVGYMIAVMVTFLSMARPLSGILPIDDPILKYMCSSSIGETFWQDLIQCDVVLNDEFLSAIRTCVPISTEDEAEQTRAYVCSYPENWPKMMECVNNYLIDLRDDNDSNLEISPNDNFIICIKVLLQEARRALETGEPFLR